MFKILFFAKRYPFYAFTSKLTPHWCRRTQNGRYNTLCDSFYIRPSSTYGIFPRFYPYFFSRSFFCPFLCRLFFLRPFLLAPLGVLFFGCFLLFCFSFSIFFGYLSVRVTVVFLYVIYGGLGVILGHNYPFYI